MPPSISQSSANLQGSLLSTGGETPIITIVWGDEDHGADFSNLANWDFNQSLGYTRCWAIFYSGRRPK